MNRNTGDAEQLEYSYRGELDYPASAAQAALYSPEDSMTPGEEEVMRSYEDGISRPPDMTEKPRGLQKKESGIRPGSSWSLQTALRQPVAEAADSDSELEELLRDAPEPGTPPVRSPTQESPLIPEAARINPEAANKSAEDMEAVVDQLQTVVEGLLPWLKDDISSSGSLNPRTPCPDIELEDLLEFEAAA